MKQISTMSTAEMVVEYNTLTGKSIKKFSSRAAGEKQLAAARKEHPLKPITAEKKPMTKKAYSLADGCPHCGAKEDQQHQQTQNGERVFCHNCHAVYDTEGKVQQLPISTTRSKAISESWQDKKVAEQRARRDNVSVKGVGTFRSVCEAFKKIGLPMNQHIKFRMEVKNAGKGTFKTGDKSYEFTLVEQNKLV